MIDSDKLTLDELRIALAPTLADAAVFDGWSQTALDLAAGDEGVDRDLARLAFKGGPMAMIVAWIDAIDAEMALAWPSDTLEPLKIRERIRTLIAFRLDALRGREEALRRALAIMAMPQNAARSLRTGWRSADLMWRLAGDTATDLNHYSKRAILATVYATTLTVFVADESEEHGDTHAFLDRRLADVMRFEKVKRQFANPDRERFSVARFLGRLRYPAR